MPKYRKKPMIVDAMRFNEEGSNGTEVLFWALKLVVKDPFNQERPIFVLQVPSPEDPDSCYHTIATRCADGEIMYANAGDYVIRGEHGDFHLISAAQFEKVYEPLIATTNQEIIL